VEEGGAVSDEATSLIEIGVVGAPFGVRGWVKLRSFTDPPDRLLEHRNLKLRLGGAWRCYSVEASGRTGAQLRVKLTGVEDRDGAQALRGAQVAVSRRELPPRASKEYYRADLIGCEVVNLKGIRLGVVQHFVEVPAHALMVVRGEREHWVPAVPEHVRRVDLEARRIIVDWDEAA
jgi:16S rRNA processing protein RimM